MISKLQVHLIHPTFTQHAHPSDLEMSTLSILLQWCFAVQRCWSTAASQVRRVFTKPTACTLLLLH